MHQTKPILKVLSGEPLWPLPIWMMRQAGRYLPEYRELRSSSTSFLDFCFNSKKACEATLQPIRRFGFDAAILFSDILVIPHALGQKVRFEEGEGPKLDPIKNENDLLRLDETLLLGKLSPVFETLERVKSVLPEEVALLGFCGAPWTVASYMIAGKSTPDQAPARIAAYAKPVFLKQLIDKITQASISYLIAQIDAGADAIQIFESFAGALPPILFPELSLSPIVHITQALKAARPQAKVIVFVRGVPFQMEMVVNIGIFDAVALDWSYNLDKVLTTFPLRLPSQGNLDPLLLRAGGSTLPKAVDTILKASKGRPHIFNLGHGIVPETPIEHVEAMIRQVRFNEF
jgi:uroporphyrinogen decarboxylase